MLDPCASRYVVLCARTLCYLCVLYGTHDSTPPRTNVEADFLGGENASTERRVYGSISAKFQNRNDASHARGEASELLT